MSQFLLFWPPTHPAKNLKNQNFEKMKKLPEISFYTCVPNPPPLPPPNNPENQNLKKIKKAYEGVTILYMCTKNHGHMVYAYWDMGATTEFSVIFGHFLTFYPTIGPKY